MKFDPEKIFNMLLLRPRKVSEEEKRYGTFNRRMIAASLDSLLVTVLIAPVIDYLFIQVYGAPTITVQEISAHASQQANSGEATRLFWEEMKSSGFLDRWLINFRWQIYALCIYATLCWHFWSATPGKILCRLKIVDSKTGERMGDWQSLLRVFGYFVSAVPLGLGFFWIGLNKKRRGWHDLLAGTEVVLVKGTGFKWKKKKADSTPTSTPESAHPSGSPAPSAGE